MSTVKNAEGKTIEQILGTRKELKIRIKKEPTVKVKKITKKEQQVIDVANTIEVPANYHLINTPELLDSFIDYYKTYKSIYREPYVFLDTETYGINPFKDDIVSISIGFMNDEQFNIPLKPFKHLMSVDIPTIPQDVVVSKLKPILENERMLVLQNAKYDVHILYNWCKIDICFNVYWDTMIAAGLLDENSSKGLKEWYKNYVIPSKVKNGEEDETTKPTFKFGSLFDKIPYDTIPHNLATYYACHDTHMTKEVFLYQKNVFECGLYDLDKVYKLFREVEMPLMPVLVHVEREGIYVDADFLEKDIGKALQSKLDDIELKIKSYLGEKTLVQKSKTRTKDGIKYKEKYTEWEDLNIKSPKQLIQKLYVEHKIIDPVMEWDSKKRKKVPKYKTDKKTLNWNKQKHPVIPYILEYRGLSKLIDAFCVSLAEESRTSLDGKVHPSYNQMVRTGRMSCSNPNLQQVPSAFSLIRYAFQASKGNTLVSCDFSQQEIRWLAIYSQEKALIDAYAKGLDMHSNITCTINHLNYECFEDIRNFERETEEETYSNVETIISKWGGKQELITILDKVGQQELTHDSIKSIAKELDLKRKKAKTTTFGTVYGISEMGLSDQLLIPKKEAKELIDNFKSGLPSYLRWEKGVHDQVLREGCVETVLGRKRRFGQILKDAYSSDLYRRTGRHYNIESCKRKGSNYIIQGSSAEQTKLAMVNIFYPKRPDGSLCTDRIEWEREGYTSYLEKHNAKLLLQVHDELLASFPEDTSYSVLEEMADIMKNVIPTAHLGVVFESDIEVSPYWGGKFSQEEIKKIATGELDWHLRFKQEVEERMQKELGYEYKLGTFADSEEEEE